jgi:hypothetical protein
VGDCSQLSARGHCGLETTFVAITLQYLVTMIFRFMSANASSQPSNEGLLHTNTWGREKKEDPQGSSLQVGWGYTLEGGALSGFSG